MEMTKNTPRLFAILLFLIIGWSASARAQDAVDQAQDVNISTVDQKANSNSNKVTGVESRLSMVETKDVATGNDVAALATGQTSLDGRVATLEAAPSIDPMIESRVATLEASPAYDDAALSARVTTLETAEASIIKWVARDSLGSFVADWFDRSAVGASFITVNGGQELRFSVGTDSIHWIGLRGADGVLVWPNNQCGADGSAPVMKTAGYTPPDMTSGDFFGGIVAGRANTRPDGSQFVTVIDSTSMISITTYKSTSNPDSPCVFNANGTDVHQSMYLFELPFFVAPFTVAQE